MKYYLLILIFAIAPYSLFSQNNSWDAIGNPYQYKDNLQGTGIEKIYLFSTTTGAAITFTTTASVVRFYKYTNETSEMQPIPAADITSTSSGNKTTYTINNLEDSRGYFADIDGGISSIVWIVDYSKHHPQFNSVRIDDNDETCEYLKLILDKSDDLFFYANNGSRHRIVRRYDIEYNTLEWNEEKKTFDSKIEKSEGLDIGTDSPPLNAPLKNTTFKVTGDQFAKHFGLNFQSVTEEYKAKAVQAYIDAEQINGDEPGEISAEKELSAPAGIRFYGYANEPVAHFFTWKIYKKDDLENPIVRYTDRDMNYEFKEAGDYIIQLEVESQGSGCPPKEVIETLTVTDFMWDAPNFLLLDGNHQFRISYNSVLNFKCTIFNRWGNKVYEWRDPSQGWDGRHNGKYVSTGAYYYIMTAESGDGKKQQKSGSITVIKPK